MDDPDKLVDHPSLVKPDHHNRIKTRRLDQTNEKKTFDIEDWIFNTKKDQAHKHCDGQTNGQNKLDLLYSEVSVSSELQLSVITESVILIKNLKSTKGTLAKFSSYSLIHITHNPLNKWMF